jgi:protein-tyrosine phosphatase
VIDLHCHVLPGIDDGPPTMEDSLALATTAAANGITTIVATPHVSWNCPDNDSARIAGKVDEVNAALTEAGIAVTILPGAEVALTRAAELAPEELTRLRLGGGDWLLVECPMSPAAAGFEHVLHSLRTQGHKIVLAHPERIPAFQRDPELLERFLGDGMISQLTAGSFVGRFGKDVQKFSFRLLEAGMVHNVASDAHSSHRRPPSIAAELQEAGAGDLTDAFARAVPEAVVTGEPIPVLPEPPRRRRGLGRLFRGA